MMIRLSFYLVLLLATARTGNSFSTSKRRVAFSGGPKGIAKTRRMNSPGQESGAPKMGPPSTTTAVKGGPPQGGGPPGSSKGGPPGSKGGPPAPPTRVQKILEGAFDVGFKCLYLGDDSGIQDESKNLRVLWTRALLNSLGAVDDPIAAQLLPRKTKWVVGQRMAKWVWMGTQAVEKLDWIVNRTQFIDAQLDEFLEETTATTEDSSSTNRRRPRRQVVLLGSGYDTRSLRYSSQTNVDFYEVDLPEIILTKSKLVNQYLEQKDATTTTATATITSTIQFVPLDLNEVLTKNKNVVEVLKSQGFKDDGGLPTIVICEAVLFYLIPGAVQKMVSDLFDLNADRYCITDNLAKVGVAPGPPVPSPREKCEAWLKENNKELVAHDSIWGGAIHFVGAK